MKRLPKAPIKNQTNEQQRATEADRKLQFNKEIEVRTLINGNKLSKKEQQPGILSFINISCAIVVN